LSCAPWLRIICTPPHLSNIWQTALTHAVGWGSHLQQLSQRLGHALIQAMSQRVVEDKETDLTATSTPLPNPQQGCSQVQWVAEVSPRWARHSCARRGPLRTSWANQRRAPE
jgi:hypothetical protein